MRTNCQPTGQLPEGSSPINSALSERDQVPDGELRLYGLIGDPVAQVRAPYPATRRMREAGFNAVLLPVHVRPASLSRVFTSLCEIENFDGLVVTVPHKAAMAELVDDLSDRARLVGAINLARREPDGRWRGDITDGVGFVRGLERSGFDAQGRKVLLVGTGGAGSAVAVELARKGAILRVYDLSECRAFALVERLRLHGFRNIEVTDRPDPTGASLVVNATPLGMKPDDPLPVDPSLLTSSMMVADVVMKPQVTALVQQARRIGCRTQLGEVIMNNQLDAMVAFLIAGRICGGIDLATAVVRGAP